MMLAWHFYHWELGIHHGIGALVVLVLLVTVLVLALGGKSNN